MVRFDWGTATTEAPLRGCLTLIALQQQPHCAAMGPPLQHNKGPIAKQENAHKT